MKSASVACAIFYFSQLMALPEGFQLVGGDAKISVTDGLSMTIEIGKSAIIDWQKFSVGRDEAIRFLQEGPGSSVLNRVAAGSESVVLGMLESNGKVYLINPDGIFVGPDARIVTADFIGSSLDVLDEDFLKEGDFFFAGDGKGSVVNKGSIIGFAGDVVLVAREARNEGRIEAPQGLAGLAAGAEVLLKPSGPERIFIRPDAQLFAEADNRGLMKGLAVEMKSGGSAYAAAVKSSGIAEAYSTKEEGGRIYLCAEEGDIEISGRLKAEGEISVVGQGVDILGSARLDVSGEGGGGNISVSAFDLEVEEGAFFAADARGEGDGGRVVLIAENENRFFGEISSQALARGKGGFAEVSGGSIWVGGHADMRSASGEYGTFLCDPGPDQAPVGDERP